MMRRGHEVQVAAPDKMAEKIQAKGLTHLLVGCPSEEEMDAFFSQFSHLPELERSPHIIGGLFAGLLPRMALPLLQKFTDEWRPHLIVREAGEYGALILSGLTGIPHVRVSVSNGHTFARMIEPADALRKEFGLVPDQGAAMRNARAFSAFPASMEPSNGDCATLPQFRVSASTPTVLTDKLDWASSDGIPRIYMTFGTVMGSSDDAKAVFRATLAAVGGEDLNVLMTTGPAMDVNALGPIPKNVTMRDFVPQSDVFPHVDAMLCHGGSGSILGALSAGLPLVVTPIGADQPENASAVAALGAGIAVNGPDVQGIREALHKVLTNQSYRDAAQRVASEMKEHAGIEEAVDEMLTYARSLSNRTQ
jgi:UDP:flavonoid glycosyltransferase YjiC (YdhE family)